MVGLAYRLAVSHRSSVPDRGRRAVSWMSFGCRRAAARAGRHRRVAVRGLDAGRIARARLWSSHHRLAGVVLVGVRAVASSPCCTSPSGTSRCAPTRSSSRRPRCGPSTTASRRSSSGRSATRRSSSPSTTPDEAVGRAYGTPTADGDGSRVVHDRRSGRCSTTASRQAGVVHGRVDVMGRRHEKSQRCRRCDGGDGGPAGHARDADPPGDRPHRAAAPFAFPDGSVADWVLTPQGWRTARGTRRCPASA